MPSGPRSIARKLSAYEKDQVAEIAGWKAQSVNPIAEVWNVVVLQAARLATIFIPTAVARSTIELSYRAAFAISPPESIARHAGVRNLRELRKRPLEECDQLARHAAFGSELMAIYEGALTGMGGPFTTLIDVPILFISALRSIVRTGQCYGYPAEEPNDRFFNLGILTVATAGSLATRLERLNQLQDLEELLVRETQVEMIRSELMSFLFQLEIFEDIPGIGVISGGLLNLAFMRRVDMTARRIYQERWLKDNGKVREIAPDRTLARSTSRRLTSVAASVARTSCFCAGWGATFPVVVVASLFTTRPHASRPAKRRRMRPAPT